jgi:glycosyltransferase involved in cell wall biosynthesis
MGMNDIPFFTVGIPTYNRANFLCEAVVSVLGQTFQDFELIIADNHSGDHTEDVVTSFKDDRIRYVRHEKNCGARYNFNYIANGARGKYFVLLQDDDLLKKTFLERAHECLNKDDSLVMYATPFWRGSEGDGYSAELMNSGSLDCMALSESKAITFNGQEMAVSLLYSFPFRHPSIVLKTSDFKTTGLYDQPVSHINDLLMEAKLLCRGNLAYDPHIGSIDRIHGGNASRQMGKRRKRYVRYQRYPQLITILEKNGVGWEEILEKQLGDMSFSAMIRLFRRFLHKGYVAPAPIVNLTWEKIQKKNPKSQFWLWNRLLNKLGPGRLFRFFLLKTKGMVYKV